MDHVPGKQESTAIGGDALAFFEDLGKSLAAPLLAGMVQWVAGELERDPPDALLFFSRDGKILKTLWGKGVRGRIAEIPTRYVLASRRCLGIAGLKTLDEKALRFLGSHADMLTVRTLVGRTGLQPEAFAGQIRKATGLDLDTPAGKLSADRKKHIFKTLEKPLLEHAAVERQAYTAYLKTLGIHEMRKLAVVDVGWHGSLQHAFSGILQTLNSEVEVCGYYAALFKDAGLYRKEGNRMRGFLLEDGLPEQRYHELRRFVEVVEFLFSAEEPGLLTIELDKAGQPGPVFLPEERDAWQLEATRALYRGIHEGFEGVSLPRDPDRVYERMRSTGLEPTRSEARYLGKLRAARGFGMPHQIQPLACKGQVVRNLCHWSGFVRRFKEALWRPGFWAQLTPPERFLLRHLSPEGSRPYLRQARRFPL